jgi:hypothetical protein
MKASYYKILLLVLMWHLLGVHHAAAQTGYIQVAAPPGITIFLDGEFKGKTTAELGGLILEGVKPGTHKIKAVKTGLAPKEATITVIEGKITISGVIVGTNTINFRKEIIITEEKAGPFADLIKAPTAEEQKAPTKEPVKAPTAEEQKEPAQEPVMELVKELVKAPPKAAGDFRIPYDQSLHPSLWDLDRILQGDQDAPGEVIRAPFVAVPPGSGLNVKSAAGKPKGGVLGFFRGQRRRSGFLGGVGFIILIIVGLFRFIIFK